MRSLGAENVLEAYSCFGKGCPEKQKAYATLPKGSLGID